MILDLRKHFSSEMLEMITCLSKTAQTFGQEFHLVGGQVRDIILGKEIKDVDFALSRDAVEFVEYLSSNWKELFSRYGEFHKLYSFKKFKTAKISLKLTSSSEIIQLDFSTFRKEFYTTPALPPVIEEGTLESDMKRRDFTVNALAVSFADVNFGEVIDLVGGIDDLENKELRVLHPLSFIEDPVRLIRAVRFAVRFSFVLNPVTLALFNEAVSNECIKKVPRQRQLDELRKTLCEERAEEILGQINNIGLLKQMFPFVSYPDFLKMRKCRQDNIVTLDNWQKDIAYLFSACESSMFDEMLIELNLSKSDKQEIKKYWETLKVHYAS